MLRLTNCVYNIRNISVDTCDRDIMLRLTNCDYSIWKIYVVTCGRAIMLRLTNCDYNIRNISVVTCDRYIMLRLANCDYSGFCTVSWFLWFATSLTIYISVLEFSPICLQRSLTTVINDYIVFWRFCHRKNGSRRGRDRMVVGFITTYAIIAYNIVSTNPVQARCTR